MFERSLAWHAVKPRRNGPVAELDPATKLACAGLLLVALLLTRHSLSLLVLGGYVGLVVAAAGLGPRSLAAPLRAAAGFLALCIVAQTLFYPGTGGVAWGPLRLAWEGLAAGLNLAARLGLLVVISAVLTQTTTFSRLAETLRGLTRPLGPHGRPIEELLLLLTLAARWVPILLCEVTAVVRARRLRGAGAMRLGSGAAREVAEIVGFVFGRAMARADCLAEALECRCFRPGRPRAHWRRTSVGPPDALALLATAVAVGVALYLNARPPF